MFDQQSKYYLWRNVLIVYVQLSISHVYIMVIMPIQLQPIAYQGLESE